MPIKVRIGAAAGEPVENHHGSVRIDGAARRAPLFACAAAQSLVSNVVAELCIGKGLTFQDLGEISLKGFERPVRVHAVASGPAVRRNH